MSEKTKENIYYVCEGECGAELSKEEWEAHKTKVCGSETCSHYARPFAKKER
ncbi:hypothetical protein MYX07_01925 [Patescibacteria group bacterium AH-259-L07]|nr:hypothetical protein [Patescibacteria group bacterium AH-259-L07]